jgi:hypothetical protein
MSRVLRAKTVLRVTVVAGVLLYLVVVDLGLNAGLVHRGVTLRGELVLGGLTKEEAESRLVGRAGLLETNPVAFGAEGIDTVWLYPADIGWRFRPLATAHEAMDVGREGVIEAISERARAWAGGVKLAWAGRPKTGKMTTLIDSIDGHAAAAGLELDRAKLRGKIKRILGSWPRQGWYRIPV